MNRYTGWLALFATLVPVAAFAQNATDTLAPRALPLYEQCGSLSTTPSKTRRIDTAIAGLKSEDSVSKITAAGELALSCDRRAIPALLKAMREEKDPAVRAAAMQAIGKLGDRDLIDALVEAIPDPDWRVTAELGKTLSSFQVRKASYAALNFLVNPFGRPIADERDAYARIQTILYLLQLRDVGFSRKAMLFLFALTNAENVAVQNTAREAIRESSKTKNGPHELIGILKQSPNPGFRATAVFWIGELKLESGRDILTEIAASDPDTRVRSDAAIALKKLGPPRE